MYGPITINLDTAIESISIIDESMMSLELESQKDKQKKDLYIQEREKELSSACNALKMAVAKVNQYYGNIVAQRADEIAKLSVEIARKILIQKIEAKDYEIEPIIKEALKNCPSNQDIVIHLNPDDYQQCQEIMDKNPSVMPQGVTLLPDSNVGPAECILKSPKGTILSLINDQLEQIEAALRKTQ